MRVSKGERTIVLHDFFNTPDGGGRVATILAKSFHAELLTGHLDKDSFPDGYFGDVQLRSLDAYRTSPRWLRFSKIFQLWWAFAHFPSTSALWTVFSGSFSPLAHKKISGKKIFYCLTPPRLLYDQRGFMVQQVPGWQRPFLRGVMFLYRLAYERAVGRMDIIVTISETVKKRFRRFLRYDSLVIYPPCETERFRWIDQGDYYLSTARVDPLKRVDLIVKAFKEMPDKRLVVVSGGADMPKIRKIAEGAPNIEVLGWIGEEHLCNLIGRCIATIYIPMDEDFGISPVESMAAGKPVIGVQEGGLLETVGEGRHQWSEVRGQRTEDGGQRTEGGGQRSEGGGQRTEGRGRRAEDRGQRAEGRGQRAEDRGRRTASGPEGPTPRREDGGERGKDEGRRTKVEGGRGSERRGGMLVTECGVLMAKDPGVEDVIEAVKWMTPQRAFGMRRGCEERARLFDTDVFVQKMGDLIAGAAAG